MPSFLNSFYIFRGNYVKKFDYCFDSQKKKKSSTKSSHKTWEDLERDEHASANYFEQQSAVLNNPTLMESDSRKHGV